MTTRTATMPGYQLRIGDVILEEGRKWRIVKHPVPELLDSGKVRWHIAAVAIDTSDLPEHFRCAAFAWADSHDWLVQF